MGYRSSSLEPLTGVRSPRPARPKPTPPSPPIPATVVLLLACVGAVCLGLMGQAAVHGTFRGSWELSRLGGPWLMAGFAGGAIAGWHRGGRGLLLGAATGAVVQGAGTVAYYAVSFWVGGYDARGATTMGLAWGLAGVVVGSATGLIGAAYSTNLARHQPVHGGRPVVSWLHGAALGTLGGLLIGEAMALLWIWDGADLRTMAMLEALGGAALVVAGSLGRSWRFVVAAVAAAAVAATVAPALTSLLRETLRAIGWGGA